MACRMLGGNEFMLREVALFVNQPDEVLGVH